MKMNAEEENNLRNQFSEMVEIQFPELEKVKLKVDAMVDELQTLLPQDKPSKQLIAEAKEIVIAHHIMEY